MKIEFLDETGDRAIVTIGWFRKRYTTVKRSYTDFRDRWLYTIDNKRTSDYTNWRLERARDALRWKPIPTLPEAKVMPCTKK